MKMNFALRVDLPDFDGDGDNYLEDYYWVDIANVSDVPVYFFKVLQMLTKARVGGVLMEISVDILMHGFNFYKLLQLQYLPMEQRYLQ